MVKAILLMVGAAVYIYAVKFGSDVALREMHHVQKLYTQASADVASIPAYNR